MAITVSNAFVTMFGDEISHLAQQKASLLQGAVRTVRNVTGSTYKFPTLGKGGVQKNKTSHADVLAQSAIADTTSLGTGNGTWVGTTDVTMPIASVTATIDTYATGEYIDDFDALKTNVDLRSAYAESISAAMNRAYDQVIIDALNTAHTGSALASENDTGNTELTRANITALSKALNDKSVPLEDRFLLVSPAGYNDILADNTIVTAQAGTFSDAMRTGVISNVLGFTVIMSNQLATVNTSDKRGFAFHKDAVGCAVGKDITTMVNYVPQKLSTLVAAEFSAGAVAIDINGIASVGINA
jgi:hypothetical protein